MGEASIQDKLISYIRDAHAMESNVLRMLDSLIATTDDEQIRPELERHRTETERHEKLLGERLEELGSGASSVKDIPAMLGALIKGMGDAVRTDKAGKNARDAYVTEAMEIAAYRLLEELAIRAGDETTASLARTICRDEERMRDVIESNWPRFIDLTLREAGVSSAV